MIDGEPQRLELYKDEKISLTQNIINYQDISKVFADYSQSFTIPCSKVNNRILSHWYENSVNDSFDHRVRYNGFIEIDTFPFKDGSFQLESVSFKNGQPESYKITFFGKVKQLKDLFGDDKLSSLDYSTLNHPFTASEVLTRITSASNYEVRYPLFAHDRLYDFGGGGANDVTTNTGAIQWNSLFPAIKVPKIMDLIESKYGITFSSIFFSTYNQYKKLWMLLKNAEVMVAQSVPLRLNFISKSAGFPAMDLTNDVCDFRSSWTYIGPPDLTFPDSIPFGASIRIFTTSSVNYRINYYRNGQFVGQSETVSGNYFFDVTSLGYHSSPNKIHFEMVSDAAMTFSSEFYVRYYHSYFTGSGIVSYDQTKTAIGATQTTTSNLNIQNYVPDMKVYDFFIGLVKMFNLVIVPKSETEFTIEPLELWYSLGTKNDITEFIQTESIESKKPSIFKKIDFKYEKSENILNAKFRELFTSIRGFDYGDLSYTSVTDITEAKYEVKLPFENVMYERDNNSTLLTTTFKKMDLTNYVPKPVLMYENGLTDSKNSAGTTTSMKYYNGSTYQNFNGYFRFSNELSLVPNDNTNILSLNFNEEISAWTTNVVINGLYARLYDNFIENLYNIKSRIINVKCKLSSKKLAELKMSDNIFIGDKRYVINNVTTDLTTGECDFELMTDFRKGINGQISFVGTGIGFRMSNIESINIPKDALNVDIVVFKGEFEQFDYVASPNGLLTYVLKTGVTETEEFNLTMPANTTGVERSDSVVIKYYLDGQEYYYFINVIQGG
jgi:hypothetical protein